MKLLHYSLLLFLVTLSINSFSQETPIAPITIEFKRDSVPVKVPGLIVIAKIQAIKPPTPISHWTKKNMAGFDMNEISFSNWNAGGVSSISGLIKGEFTRIHTLKKSKWFNELVVRYGVNKQDGYAIRKSDDAIRFTSTFGYRKDS